MMSAITTSRAGLILLGGALLLTLAACKEPEVILRGEREDIREGSSTRVQNQSRAISLPQQTANSGWQQSHGIEAYRTAHPALSSAPQQVWSVSIGAGDERRNRITATPVVGDGRIYTLDSGVQVSAVSAAGQILWTADLIPSADGGGTGGGLAFHEGVVYVSSGYGVLTALEAKSGKQIWRQKLEATGSGQPSVGGGLVYVVAGDDTGWAVNAKDGRIAWQISATPSPSNVLGGPAPALTSDLAIFAFGAGDLTATFRNGGLRRWSASVAGKRVGHSTARIGDVTGGPVVVGNRAYVGNHSGRTVAFDLEDGSRIWTAREGALGPVWPAGGSLFQVSDLGRLLRLDASTGEVIWAITLPGYLKDKPGKRSAIVAHYGPVLAGGTVIVASNDGLLRLFKPEDGSLVRTIEVPGGATTAPIVVGKTLYVVSTKGELHAFR
ncbi:PQQ-like beta-propeller repeat protein [Parasedimentitalea psychrophila]|uniref:PQQ-binding-like beta-propeller repeat protein n=1 Tax=Parasedimentitalea psychrophila TaxID=2997337 RepID=A0A9Y2KW26_9RHOB|nr:PQQ-like beta-propeller repeat protein [Parasedimentitalea psychrophila]WIY23588.1 PQQ-binding-like beta-propeller repeat protein [Parasedimentitalea psychrophila]